MAKRLAAALLAAVCLLLAACGPLENSQLARAIVGDWSAPSRGQKEIQARGRILLDSFHFTRDGTVYYSFGEMDDPVPPVYAGTYTISGGEVAVYLPAYAPGGAAPAEDAPAFVMHVERDGDELAITLVAGSFASRGPQRTKVLFYRPEKLPAVTEHWYG